MVQVGPIDVMDAIRMLVDDGRGEDIIQFTRIDVMDAIRTLVADGRGEDIIQFTRNEMMRDREAKAARYMNVGKFLSTKTGYFARLSAKSRFAIAKVIAENMDEIRQLIEKADKEGSNE